VCMRRNLEGSSCCGVAAAAVDALVGQQVLAALTPAAVELSLQAQQQVQQERQRLHDHWRQRLERAAHEAQRAERQYHHVEPENRLVARSLEQRWEEALRSQRGLVEEYDRFVQAQPHQLSAEEQRRIRALAEDIPALWHAAATSGSQRKEIVRQVVERVVVHLHSDRQEGEVEIVWKGERTSRHELIRPVARYEAISGYDQLLERIEQLRQSGRTIAEVACQVNAEGYRTPRSQKGYTSTSIRKLLWRLRQKAAQAGPQQPGPKSE
jgi:hypothetical protein